MPDEYLLQALNLAVRQRTGCREVNLDQPLKLRAGDCHVFLAERNTGKTLLMETLALRRRFKKGTISIRGCHDQHHFEMSVHDSDLRRVRNLRWDKIRFIPQRANLLGFLTARSNIGLMASDHRDLDSRVDAILNSSPPPGQRLPWLTPEKLGERPDRLDAEQRKLVAIACALIRPAPILIADAPTFGIRPTYHHELWSKILAQASVNQGTAVVVATDKALNDRQIIEALWSAQARQGALRWWTIRAVQSIPEGKLVNFAIEDL